MSDTTRATDPTAEPMTDPTTLRDADGVEYQTTERVDDAEHFERHEATAGFAAVAVTNAEGEIALTETGPVWILPHAGVEPGEDFVDVAGRAADDLLGLDVTIDRVVRARRKDCTLEDSDRETTIHDVVFEATPADDAALPDADDVQSCQADAIAWFEHVPESVPENEVRDDIVHFVGEA